MQNVQWPTDDAKVGKYTLTVKAHSRGLTGKGGEYAYERGPGAHFEGNLEVVPMPTESALVFRAFLHSLRGRGGTFLFRIPVPLDAPDIADGTPVTFSDDTFFSDTTYFDDFFDADYAPIAFGFLTASAALGDTEIVIDDDLLASDFFDVGAYLVIGDIETDGQLLRIVSVSGNTVTIRPRLRQAYISGTPLYAGRVTGKFRLDQETPEIPLLGHYANGVSVQIAEAY